MVDSKYYMTDFEDRYDWIGEFHQGVAIVKKNEMYGAIMIGGKEIFPPIYDHLSNFENGYATATYLGEDRTVNLSGQIQVRKGNELVFLPEEYDWGYDFIDEIYVIVKERKYGIINANFQIIESPSFKSYSGFTNGYAIFGSDAGSCIVDSHGKIIYERVLKVGREYFIVSTSYDDGLYGLVDEKLDILIPCIYNNLRSLSIFSATLFQAEKYGERYVINLKGEVLLTLKRSQSITPIGPYWLIESLFGAQSLVDSEMNEILKTENNERISGATSINKYFNVVDVTSNNNIIVHYIFTATGKKALIRYYNSKILPDNDVLYHVSTYKGLYKIKSDGAIYLLKTNWETETPLTSKDLPTISSLKGIEVSSDFLNYSYFPFSLDRLLVHDYSNGCRGLSDMSGGIIVSPIYKVLVRWINNLLIVAEENDGYLRFGIIDTDGKVILPFDYGFIKILGTSKQLSYSIDAKLKSYNLVVNAEVSIMPSGHIFLMGLLDSNLKSICNPKYNNIEVFSSSYGFYRVTIGKESGIIDKNGKEIIQVKYEEIKKSKGTKGFFVVSGPRKKVAKSTSIGEYSRFQYSNVLNKNGEFIVLSPSGQDVLVPSDTFDWCSNFNDEGYANVLKNGIQGKINLNKELISLNNEQQKKVPKRFSWAYDFKYGYVPVSEGSEWGIADLDFNIIIPCEYYFIEPLCPDYFVFQTENNGKYGLLDKYNLIIAGPNYKSIIYKEGDYIELEKDVRYSSDNDKYEIIDGSGNHIIPIACSYIDLHNIGNKAYWIIKNKGKMGVFFENQFVIPQKFDNIEFQDNSFVCEVYDQKYSNSNGKREIKFSNVYSVDGELQLCIDKIIIVKIPREYETAKDVGFGLIGVVKENMWGIINSKNEIIISPQFSFIDNFNGSFAKVGNSKDNQDCPQVFFSDKWWRHMKWGIIDTFGDIVIPVEYDYIEKWDNGYYLLTKDNTCKLLSPSLNSIMETCGELKKLDDRFVIAKKKLSDYIVTGLYDFGGNVIIPADEEHSFSQIEVLDDGFLRVTYYKSNHNGGSHFAIINSQGKTVYDNRECDEISYWGTGLLCVRSFVYTNMSGSGHSIYKLINLQGNELLDSHYRHIEMLENGKIVVQGDEGWGMADISGNIVVAPKYLNKVVYENGIADINILASSFTQKINERGIVIVHNGKDEIELPENVYWGTDYVNGLSIVRQKGRGIGVIDIKGKMIIPAQYKCVTLLSDNTIRVMDGDCYGLFDVNGETILPPVFTDINYIAKDRIRVEWNLFIAKEWDRKGYVPGGSYSKYKGSNGDLDYRVCNRTAICNLKGEIINDREFLYVGDFVNNYAKAYKKVVKGKIKLNSGNEVDAIKYQQVGVIDSSGNIIVQPLYDSIVLYKESSYAKVCKDGIYGIIHLPSASIRLFDDMPIKYIWDVDVLGRCLYSEDCEYKRCDDGWDWIGGTRGVLSQQGIIVPAGKYHNIRLLSNGLIEVSNDVGDLYGLLDKDGNEILPIKYTYISSFKGNFATICIDGEKDYYSNKMIKGGKWGVIDNTGKIVKDCIFDDEEKLENENVFKDRISTSYRPSVILSDSISEPKENNTYDYGYDSYRDNDDEGPYSKYGGYNGWDDDTIDEAFDGNPELTWNID